MKSLVVLVISFCGPECQPCNKNGNEAVAMQSFRNAINGNRYSKCDKAVSCPRKFRPVRHAKDQPTQGKTEENTNANSNR